MRDLNFYKTILILAILVGVVGFSFAANTERVTIYSTGQIIPEIVAKSGYWRDIQDAVNIAASSGIGIVRIPEGTWNFVNPRESWTGSRVIIPAGVSIFGAPTERYENGSVKEWKTVLVMPWDMLGDKSWHPPRWFEIRGTGDLNKPSRFSDIKMVGYRHFNSSAVGHYRAIYIAGVQNFRIDHCAFIEIPEGVGINQACDVPACGVIDHCYFHNEHVWYSLDWNTRVVGYAIAVYRGNPCTYWEPNLQDFLGKYNNYTLFVEDCIFTKWRSIVAGGYGAHYVFRHNIVIHGLAHGEIDLHPSWNPPNVATRAVEVYNNIFIDPDPVGNPGPHFVSMHYAGAGVYFNNTVSGYSLFILDANPNWDETFRPHDVYIWGNDLGGAALEDGPMEQDVDYFLYKPDWYTPYTYPHPLATG